MHNEPITMQQCPNIKLLQQTFKISDSWIK